MTFWRRILRYVLLREEDTKGSRQQKTHAEFVEELQATVEDSVKALIATASSRDILPDHVERLEYLLGCLTSVKFYGMVARQQELQRLHLELLEMSKAIGEVSDSRGTGQRRTGNGTHRSPK